MKRHAAAIVIVLAASVWFQAWFLGLTPGGIKLGDSKLSNAYTEALAHGQSYLLTAPDPRLLAAKDPFGPATASLMISDTSYFRGHFYVYFGIVPFVVFMIPWFYLTGAPPSPEIAILFFSVTGFAAYASILWRVIRNYKPEGNAIGTSLALIAIIVASGTWPLMGRPAIYEIENAAAYAFFSFSLAVLVTYEIKNPKSDYLLALTATFAALTMGCRPNYFPAVAVIITWTLYRLVYGPTASQISLAHTLPSMSAPIIVGLLLAIWNYHRFGSIFEFGLRYTISSNPKLARPLSSIANLPYHLHRYVLGVPRIGRFFPFIQGQHEGPFSLGPTQEISNQVYGFVLISPILLAALFALFGYSPIGRSMRTFCWICMASFLGNFLFLSSVTMSCYRYPADFLGPLAAVAGLGIVAAFDFSSFRSLGATTAVALLSFWSLSASLFDTFSVAQTTELFDQKREDAFALVGRPFNRLVYFHDSVFNDGPRAIELELMLPNSKFGDSEPLLVTGENGAQDFVYAYYSGPGVLQVGFESTGNGGVLSRPASIDYRQRHKIKIAFGSFLGPIDSPYFGRLSRANREHEMRLLKVYLDGQPVLDAPVIFHLPRAQIFVGTSPFDRAFGRSFSGTILSIGHPLIQTDGAK